MKEVLMEWLMTYGWIPMVTIGVALLSFGVWIVIKLLQHFAVI